jgi:Spy/CpxP family protein refolding chaperone
VPAVAAAAVAGTAAVAVASAVAVTAAAAAVTAATIDDAAVSPRRMELKPGSGGGFARALDLLLGSA